MKYAEYLSIAEMQRWILDTDIPWSGINREKAYENPEILERVRDSALIESFFPIFTPRVLDLLWDNVNATAIFSIQLYESYKHFHVFNQYLHFVGYRPLLDEDLVEVRRKNRELSYTSVPEVLTKYMMSEHFAAYHFFKDANKATEPVLSQILRLVAKDEVRHTQFAYELLEDHLKQRPGDIEAVIHTARNFKHIGLYVVPNVPVSESNDFTAIFTLNEKIRRLTGKGIESREGHLYER